MQYLLRNGVKAESDNTHEGYISVTDIILSRLLSLQYINRDTNMKFITERKKGMRSCNEQLLKNGDI